MQSRVLNFSREYTLTKRIDDQDFDTKGENQSSTTPDVTICFRFWIGKNKSEHVYHSNLQLC